MGQIIPWTKKKNTKLQNVWCLKIVAYPIKPHKKKKKHPMDPWIHGVLDRSQIHIRVPGPPTTANLDTPGISASPVPGWVVVEPYPSEKYGFVSRDYDIPNGKS